MPFFFLHSPDIIRIISSTSSMTARILSMCILLLSIAPLGSIYILMFSLGFFGATEEETDTTFSRALISQNMTLDEIWSTVFAEKHYLPKNSIVFAYIPLGEYGIRAHLRVFLPWAISFAVGVIIPAMLSIWSFLRSRRILEARKQKRDKRLNRALSLLNKSYTMQLTLDDLLVEANTDKVDLSSADKWKIPVASQSICRPEKLRIVEDGCAICLHSYQLNEFVSWSANEGCKHTFHEHCIVEWLSRKRNKGLACPCCRQSFVPLASEKHASVEVSISSH